uniref:Uncharacterized protein n=2 Tax=viral metagenome TaxID=1070528 RepID=A0A6M3JD13_9ZZZZ
MELCGSKPKVTKKKGRRINNMECPHCKKEVFGPAFDVSDLYPSDEPEPTDTFLENLVAAKNGIIEQQQQLLSECLRLIEYWKKEYAALKGTKP